MEVYKKGVVGSLSDLSNLSNRIMLKEYGGDLNNVRVAYSKGSNWPKDLDWPAIATYVAHIESRDINDPSTTFVWKLDVCWDALLSKKHLSD